MSARVLARVLTAAAVVVVTSAVGAGTSSAAAVTVTQVVRTGGMVDCPVCHDPCLYDPEGNEVICVPMHWPPP